MTHAFTHATERALVTAARYSPGESLGLPETLLGLLSETECLAAAMLGECQIDTAAVLARFPGLVERPAAEATSRLPFSTALRMVIAAVEGQCSDLPYELATEHLLLGLLLVENEVADWLAERGLDPAQLEARVRARYRQSAPVEQSQADDGPLPVIGADVEEQNVSHDGESGVSPAAASPCESTTSSPSVTHFPRHAEGMELTAWRAIDASANRTREGLRVVEDYVRFALDDRHLTGELKQLRHDLTEVLQEFPRDRLHAARDTEGDVGTQISTQAEWRRDDILAIVEANFGRTAEALRSLEEFSKLVSPNTSKRIERLRYRLYTLEQAVAITVSSLRRLASAQLYVLIDGGESLAHCETRARSLVAAGIDMLQLRDKRLDDRELLERARRLRAVTAETSTLLIVNDRPDVAAIVGADGVHLGQEDMSLRDARRIVGADALIGVSTHSPEQARQAVIDGANYIGVGPTFPSGTKNFAAFTGMELLCGVAREIRLPAFAIGGITPANFSQVLAAGFTRVAVSGAVTTAADPATASRDLLKLLRSIASDG
jgi:thiamine-phosphate pyrophosphorylase